MLPNQPASSLGFVRPVRLGMLTPSSNTVLEPVCSAILDGLSGVSVHFTRFRVTEIALTDAANDQFNRDAMLRAAELLADARVNAICWNGTSASWLGLERDRAMSRDISEATGIAATSAVLAMVEVLRLAGFSRLGLVTPYVDNVQGQIVETLAGEGLEVVAERHLGLSENFAFGAVADAPIAQMIRETAESGPQAILVMCTNLRAAPLAGRLEAELGIPILDSVATSVWGSLRIAGFDTTCITGWGRLFQCAGSASPGTSAPVAFSNL